MSEAIKRHYGTLTYEPEKKLLDNIAGKIYKHTSADQLTFLALIGAILVAISYYLAGTNINWLYLANFGIFLHWFGDSLDGRTALLRNEARPKYGHYLDHVIDAISISIIFLGIHFSSLTRQPYLIYALIVALLIANHTHLKTISTNIFDLSVVITVGGTEARILFFLLNLVFIFTKNATFNLFSHPFTVIDFTGLIIFGICVFGLFYGISTSLWGEGKIKD
jgi:archaetidylinositol phosphate synthase